MNRILLVEDDVELAAMLCEYLALEGFAVDAVDAVNDGEATTASQPADHDLIVLDVMLPKRSGFEVLKALRQHSNIPVILLTARDGETDRVVGLELGADDYVPKPFKPRELVARIRAVLRRARQPVHGAPVEPLELQVGDVHLSRAARFATRGDRRPMAAVLGGTRVGIILKGEHRHERGDPSASSGSKLPGGRCLTVVGAEGGVQRQGAAHRR